MCWGNRGKVITQSWNLLSGFKSLSLKGYHHLGRSHPPSRTLLGERGSVPAYPAQTIFSSYHNPHNFSCSQKAANNQLPVHHWWCYLPEAKLGAHLTDRHSADAGVQEPCGRVGTHFTHKGEFLFPADTVFLNFLSMRMKKKKIQIKVQSQIKTSY